MANLQTFRTSARQQYIRSNPAISARERWHMSRAKGATVAPLRVPSSGEGGLQPISVDEEVIQLRKAVQGLRSLNADLQSEIAQVVQTLSNALDAITQADVTGVHGRQDQQQHQAEARSNGSTSAAGPIPLAPSAPAAAVVAARRPVQPLIYHQPPEVAQARLSCSVPHPGALCCTKTSMSEADGMFVVNVSTTARATRGHLSAVDLAAIGARALECAAQEFSRGRSASAQAVVHPSDRLQRHKDLCSLLAEGEVLVAESNPIQSPYGHASFKLLLQHPVTGQSVSALFKPRVSGDAHGWHRAPIEVVAYKLNLLLGFDYVPPCVYRTGGLRLQLNDGVMECNEGAMLLWVEAAQPMEQMPSEAFLSDTRILDVLIQNSDRHRGHFLVGRHWAAQPPAEAEGKAELCPVLIDHAAGFRKEGYVTMDHENAFCTGPVRKVRASTYLRLRLLDRHTCQEQFGDCLTEQELRDLLHRRNYVLRYLDNLVAEQGYDETVLDG